MSFTVTAGEIVAGDVIRTGLVDADGKDVLLTIERVEPQQGRKVRLHTATGRSTFSVDSVFDIEPREGGRTATELHEAAGPQGEQVGAGSPGMRGFEAFAFQTGTDTRTAVKHPCPHCGKGIDCASGEKGTSPRPGDLSLCVYCCGFLRYGEGLALLPLGDAELDALDAEGHAAEVAKLREMRDLFRASRMEFKRGVEA